MKTRCNRLTRLIATLILLDIARHSLGTSSELTFVTENLIRQLNVSRQRSAIIVSGIGGKESTQTRGIVLLTLRSTRSNATVNIQAHVLHTLTTILPSFEAEPQEWPHLKNLSLADPDFLTPRAIDILIGADAYGQIIKPNIIKHSPFMPIAQLSIFGWLILGPVNRISAGRTSTHHVAIQANEEAIHELLTKFWVQEEVPTHDVSVLTPEEQKCETHFRSTHSRDSSGRYTVRIPLKSPSNILGDSYNIAHQCLKSLLRRFARDPAYQRLYQDFMAEYQSLNHMTKASSESHHHSQYYLPHHGVLKPDSATTKLRVVFNGSSLSTSGYSINDLMHTGAKLHLDITDVLLWIRQHRHIVSTDITKMYRQIKVHKDDWDLQRILWIDDQLNEVPYQLTTVTYGTKAAPFLAVRTLLQLAEDEGYRFPLAVPSITHGRYVDDIFGGADTVQQLKEVACELRDLCMAGGFPLAKWHATHIDVINALNNTQDQGSPITFDDCATKILGLQWLPQEDVFSFSLKTPFKTGNFTKRLVLSEVAQIFDPLGFASPVVIKAKMLLQELWLHKLHWDEQLPSQLSTRWLIIREELTRLANLSIPRWFHTWTVSTVELHGFSDASQLAMAAVVYLSVHDSNGARISFVCSKTKVAPLKRLSIPRLELTAALLLSRLVKHIPGTSNPADCASRGLTTAQLQGHSLWWTGPPWLINQDSWPPQPAIAEELRAIEARPGVSLIAAALKPDYHWDIIYRFISRVNKNHDSMPIMQVSTMALEKAKLFWIKATQAAYFSHELKALQSNSPLPKTHAFSRLTAYIDAQGVIRVGGRLAHSSLSPDGKHPAILPHHSHLTSLIIAHSHQRTLHGGTQLTLAHIRQTFWILGGRAPVKSYILKCVACARQRGIRAHQLMGQLPLSRATPSRPFTHTGVDYAGPLTIKTWKGRGAKSHKSWICVFVCFSTSAVHLEAVSDYSSDAFIAAYRRFSSRRGIAHALYSDCGTTFIGADTSLKRLFVQSSQEHQRVSKMLAQDSTRWEFNPPATPHMGGKWEAV
ncbi:uncharacterized protein LOC105833904, partial [Monomorium pharaonis]|uniref:uncharacterized protein LOC105833904 n=1 Tax=Monomorium pharaonis TaxID=307658 RepID=UPI0017463FD5